MFLFLLISTCSVIWESSSYSTITQTQTLFQNTHTHTHIVERSSSLPQNLIEHHLLFPHLLNEEPFLTVLGITSLFAIFFKETKSSRNVVFNDVKP